MTTEDKKEFAQLIAVSVGNAITTNAPKKETDIYDLGFKALSTLSMALIVWIFSTTNQTKQDVAVIKQNYEHTTEAINEMKKFTAEPRFTKEDFQTGVTPLINNLNTNTVKISNLSAIGQTVESRLIKLE